MLVSEHVEKPETDTRSYRIVRLDNELEALLVHDADTDKASAALDVHVGHLSDPWDAAGLAHFCEHLLFMGTEKYPRENDYSEYLSSHNGSSNAYTGTVDTNYFFDVGHEYLEPALDRFSQFFLTPLFLESCKDRELLAVDSENKKNLQNDMWRAYQLEKSLSNPEHVYSKFGTGNIETLKDIPANLGHDVRDELLKFHSELYSANQMKLVLLGRESLDELEALVTSKFSGILNKKKSAPMFSGHILRPGQELGTIYTFKPIKEVRNLELCFPIPECDLLWRSQPAHYLSHLIGHEGQGSILSYLKARGWVLYLGAGGSDASPGTDFFKINMELTLVGAQNWERIVETIFAYINILKKDGIQQWIFDELKLISEAQFRFKERQPASRFTSSTAGKLQSSIEKRFILGTSVPREFKPDEIQSVLDALNYKNFRVAFADPAVKDAALEEKYYGTQYRVDRLSDYLLERCSPQSQVNIPDLHLPLKNEFVPEHFDTHRREVAKVLTKPSLIKHTPFVKVWHKKDDTFWVPKANYLFLMRNPAYRVSAQTTVMTKLFLELLKDNLNEYAYNADIAGLQYAMDPTVGAFTLTFSGYNDKMDILIERVARRMKHLKIDSDRFDIEKDRLLRDLSNFDYEAPYTQVGYHMSFLQARVAWSKEQQAAALLHVDLKIMQEFATAMFDKFHIEVLAHGNLREEEVLTTTQNVLNILSQNKCQAEDAKAVILLKTKSTPIDPYESAFVEKGFRPYFVPVLEHSMVNLDRLCSSCSAASQQYSGMIVTSQRSVEAIGQILPKLEQKTKQELLCMPIYTVGPATCKAIENLGFSNVLGSESGNGDVLATYILDHRDENDTKPLFFIVGDKRRDIISKRMAKANATLEELVVYETGTAPSFESEFKSIVEEAGSIEWLVFFSPAGADVALQHIVSTDNKTKIATIGPTTEDYLVSQWSTRPDVVSPRPDADSLTESLSGALKSSMPLSAEDTGPMRALWMPRGSHSVSHSLKDPSNTNSCIEYFVQVGPTADMIQLATTRLFAQVCAEPAFNQLRTKEQLGYVVASGSKVTLTSNGFRILIQSERDASYLASRIDSFLDVLRELLIDMSGDEFTKHKTSLLDKLNEKPKNLAQETKRYWSHITSGLYNFDEQEQQTTLLQTIDKSMLIDFFDTYVHRLSTQRRHVSMIMEAHKLISNDIADISSTTVVDDVEAFKAKCQVMDKPAGRPEDHYAHANGSKL